MTVTTYKNIIFTVSLSIILGLGAFIRLYRLTEDMWWIDGARDTYVARQMWETKQFPLIAPPAGGGGEVLVNSPLYYYLLAGVWGLTHSASGIAYFFALTNILAIYVGYIIGKELGGTKLSGLTLASFISFNQILIQYSRNIFQPYLLPFVVSLIILTCIKSMKSSSTYWISFTILLGFIGINIHYSFLTILPAIIFWISIHIWKKIRNTPLLKKKILATTPLVLSIVLIMAWNHFISQSHGLKSVLDFFLLQTTLSSPYNYTPYYFLNFLFPSIRSALHPILYFGIAFYLLINSLRKTKINTKPIIINDDLFLFSLFISSTLLIFLKTSMGINEYYYAPFYYIALITINLILHKICWKRPLLIILASCIILFELNPNPGIYLRKSVTQDYPNTIELATKLYHYQTTNFGTNSLFVIHTYTQDGDISISEPAYLHQLEILSSKQMADLTPYGYNIAQRTKPNQTHYLICDHYPVYQNQNVIIKDCLNNFLQRSQLKITLQAQVATVSNGAYQSIAYKVVVQDR